MVSLKKAWISVLTFFEGSLKVFLILLIGFYRSLGTTHLGGSCRFEPSCSMYALQAVRTIPTHRAIILIIKRILRCRPGGPYGIDPVPVFKGRINDPK